MESKQIEISRGLVRRGLMRGIKREMAEVRRAKRDIEFEERWRGEIVCGKFLVRIGWVKGKTRRWRKVHEIDEERIDIRRVVIGEGGELIFTRKGVMMSKGEFEGLLRVLRAGDDWWRNPVRKEVKGGACD